VLGLEAATPAVMLSPMHATCVGIRGPACATEAPTSIEHSPKST
jgi:hypothetical protein